MAKSNASTVKALPVSNNAKLEPINPTAERISMLESILNDAESVNVLLPVHVQAMRLEMDMLKQDIIDAKANAEAVALNSKRAAILAKAGLSNAPLMLLCKALSTHPEATAKHGGAAWANAHIGEFIGKPTDEFSKAIAANSKRNLKTMSTHYANMSKAAASVGLKLTFPAHGKAIALTIA